MAIAYPELAQCIPPLDYPEGWVVPFADDLLKDRIRQDAGLVAMSSMVLRRPAQKIDYSQRPWNESVRETVGIMNTAIRILDERGLRPVGLAAQQVGISANIVAVKLSDQARPGDADNDQGFTYILGVNARSGGKLSRETHAGCLSCYCLGGPLTVPTTARATGLLLNGRIFSQDCTGSDAERIIHEYRHTRGQLLPATMQGQGRPVLWLPVRYTTRYPGDERSVYGHFVADQDPDKRWPHIVPRPQLRAFLFGKLAMSYFQLPRGYRG